MSSIDMSSIMSKVKEYAKSDDGKVVMSRKIEEYRANGITKTEGGGMIITERQMDIIAQSLIDLITTTASMCDLPQSVFNHFDSLKFTAPVLDDGKKKYVSHIYFADELTGATYRQSLDPNKYPEGIDNIVSVFETGYSAGGSVFGLWASHDIYTESKRIRGGLHFIKEAIEQFNITYRAYGIVAEYN